jgi:vacuole morphology and inheritance protein 14
LLSQQYAVTVSIIQILSYAQLDVQMLLQLSQLVKLIDMPHYAAMRMQLLDPGEYPDLIRALKGLLMLLPQGKAFESLKQVSFFGLLGL